jgi:hypothetical protein
MKDGYPLEAVLSLRRLERDERVQDLQTAQAKARDCRRELDEARKEERRGRAVLDDAIHERRLRERGGMRAADIQALMLRQDALEKELEHAVQALAAARDASSSASRALEGARERLADAQAGMKSVKKHRDAWLEETRREEERRREEDP